MNLSQKPNLLGEAPPNLSVPARAEQLHDDGTWNVEDRRDLVEE
jgi:hypothetical protein